MAAMKAIVFVVVVVIDMDFSRIGIPLIKLNNLGLG